MALKHVLPPSASAPAITSITLAVGLQAACSGGGKGILEIFIDHNS
jgi:hypothetical protein